MTTVIIDEKPGIRLPRPAGFVPPTIRKLLDDGFPAETDSYLLEGRPCEVLASADYTSDWSPHPVREIHPFLPIIDGLRITEVEFRVLVKAMHGIDA
jgi:hypothetical protein